MRSLLIFWTVALSLQAENWPMWRGSTGVGISKEKGLPTRWSATENIMWKATLSDRGNSTPIIWGAEARPALHRPD